MTWNYRVMRREVAPEEFEYGIYEVYYDDQGNVSGYSMNSMTPMVDSVEGLKYELEIRMMKAFDLETMDYVNDEFEE